jgi:hypothetical protein
VNVEAIDVNDQELMFENLENTYRLVVGDMILLRYYSTDATTEKCLKVGVTTKDTLDGINSYLIAFQYSGYEGYWDVDIGMTVYV